MTSLDNYSKIIDSVFGVGSIIFSNTNAKNPIIDSLNNQTQFKEFQSNFIARLKRLKTIYEKNNNDYKELLGQVKLIADEKNWEGAFAELAAYDFLNSKNSFLIKPIELNKTLDKKLTYADKLGNAEANLDGFIEEHNLYFDVKCFKDNVTEIMESIYKDLKQSQENVNYQIKAEYQLDTSYEEFQNNRTNLLKELKTKIKPNITYLKSEVIESLTYRITWEKGILITESTYNPYRHAENYHNLFFKYSKKFVLNSPTFIVMVKFPWFNNLISDFGSSNEILYRALSRRFFCQYKNSCRKFKTIINHFQGEESIFEITQSLSGIVFLEDDTISSKDPQNINIKSFIYLNPNATNSIRQSLVFDLMLDYNNEVIDDFSFDNY